MNKYPLILLFRKKEYLFIDDYIQENKNKYDCSFYITDNIDDLKKLFNSNYPLLITLGNNANEYDYITKYIPQRFHKSWIFKSVENFKNIEQVNYNFSYNFILNTVIKRENTRPIFSIFTTCYKSYDYIKIAYNSILNQTLNDWEWVIMDDTGDEEHFIFLKNILSVDPRVRLYKRVENSGNIGNVKNEAVALCRGKYVLEMDHDDEIMPDCLSDAYNIFEKDENIGFVYADFINMYRDGRQFEYGGMICKGYGSYYFQKINNEWRGIYITPNINNITLSHLMCMPNHPRMWRRSALMECENYSERLPICDDYEILLRTLTKYKVVKNNKIQYIQYMNDNGNNFSYIRNNEINRIGPNYIRPIFYNEYNIHNKMKDLNAYEDEKFIGFHSYIWKREKEYVHLRHNSLINSDYDKQYCIINNAILDPKLIELYKNKRNDFIFLSNVHPLNEIKIILDNKNYDKMKCYSLLGCTNDELIKYFKMLYKNDNCDYEILDIQFSEQKIDFINIYNTRSEIINSIINTIGQNINYLEIGVEYGITFQNVKALNKVAVDPDPKFEIPEKMSNIKMIKATSDDYYAELDKCIIEENDKFDIIFIDGMHQVEYIIKDIYNSLKYIKMNGRIFIDDILPFNEREQKKIPEKNYIENGILKYGEPWTGDVWKVLYFLILNFKNNFDIQIYNNSGYRGVCMLYNIKLFNIIINDVNLKIINNFTYINDFNNYKELLHSIVKNT